MTNWCDQLQRVNERLSQVNDVEFSCNARPYFERPTLLETVEINNEKGNQDVYLSR